jgi:hypothetical protein
MMIIMNASALVAIAIALWGWINPTPITVATVHREGPYRNVDSQAWADRWSAPGECTITLVAENVRDLTPIDVQRIVTHEVGHCAGVDHDSQHDGIMYPDATGHDLNGYDRAAFWHLHPAPYRLTLGMVSR